MNLAVWRRKIEIQETEIQETEIQEVEGRKAKI